MSRNNELALVAGASALAGVIIAILANRGGDSKEEDQKPNSSLRDNGDKNVNKNRLIKRSTFKSSLNDAMDEDSETQKL